MRVTAVHLCRELFLVGLVAAGGCKSVCQKHADHRESCRQDYCSSHADNPICSSAYAARDYTVNECPRAIHAIVEAQLETDCAELARQMGWNALANFPNPTP